MVLNSEIIKIHIFRYKYFKNFLYGKIFDHQSNFNTTYTSSKILLENNINQIFSSNDLSFNEIFCRKIINDKIFFFTSKNNNFELFFDHIISFENLTKENVNKNLDVYYYILKYDGTLILGIKNRRDDNNSEIEFFLDEIKEIISQRFQIVDIFSQRFIEKPNKLKSESMIFNIRNIISYFLKRIDRNRKFYIKYIQKEMQKIDLKSINNKIIPDEDYIPKKKEVAIEPLYYIFICRKYL